LGRRMFGGFFYFFSMRRESRIGISLSGEVTVEVERKWGLTKRSTYYESLIRKVPILGWSIHHRRGNEMEP